MLFCLIWRVLFGVKPWSKDHTLVNMFNVLYKLIEFDCKTKTNHLSVGNYINKLKH